MTAGIPEPGAAHSTRLAQIALNEAAFREINEEIYGTDTTGAQLASFRIVCECGADSCVTSILVAATLYSAVRSDPHRFLISDGHELLDVETIIERHGAVAIVEKRPGTPQRIAEATDPRSADAPI